MQYLLLVYMDEKRWARVPDKAKEQIWKECAAYGEDLRKRGHFLGGAPLQPAATARTLRRRRKKSLITDGPFAETKEVLAGFHLIECADIDEAIRLGEGFPGLKVGLTIEARAVLEERMSFEALATKPAAKKKPRKR